MTHEVRGAATLAPPDEATRAAPKAFKRQRRVRPAALSKALSEARRFHREARTSKNLNSAHRFERGRRGASAATICCTKRPVCTTSSARQRRRGVCRQDWRFAGHPPATSRGAETLVAPIGADSRLPQSRRRKETRSRPASVGSQSPPQVPSAGTRARRTTQESGVDPHNGVGGTSNGAGCRPQRRRRILREALIGGQPDERANAEVAAGERCDRGEGTSARHYRKALERTPRGSARWARFARAGKREEWAELVKVWRRRSAPAAATRVGLLVDLATCGEAHHGCQLAEPVSAA